MLALALCAACNTRSERTIKDSEGRAFVLQCRERERGCTVTQRGGPKAAVAGAVLRAEGRVVGVCDGGTESLNIADCRPLVCQQDDDCPPLHGTSSRSCINGLCVDPMHEVNSEDAVMLCLAGTGLGHAEALQVERYALGLNCGEPCKVPSPCRQP